MHASNSESSMVKDMRSWAIIQPWLVCFTAALFFFYEFIQMNIFNPISLQLMQDFQIDSVHLSYISSTYFLADVIFLLPAGIILDRFSTRTIIILAMILATLSTFGFALTHSPFLAGLFHFFAGIGNGFCFLCNVILISRWFPANRQALVMGLVVTLGMLGGVAAQFFNVLAEDHGWRYAMHINGITGVGILFLIWMLVQDYPARDAKQHQKERKQLQSLGFFPSIIAALGNSQNWLCGLYTSLMNLPIMLLGALWGNLYLTQTHYLNNTQASIVTSMIFWGTIVGSPLAGWFSDNLGLRRTPMLLGAIISLFMIFILIYFPHLSMRSLLALFFALGFFTSTQVISYPTIAESNPRALTGTATGIAAVIIMGGGGLAQPFFAKLMNLTWDGTMSINAPIYTTSDFLHGLYLLPIGFAISLITVRFIKETFCQQKD